MKEEAGEGGKRGNSDEGEKRTGTTMSQPTTNAMFNNCTKMVRWRSSLPANRIKLAHTKVGHLAAEVAPLHPPMLDAPPPPAAMIPPVERGRTKHVILALVYRKRAEKREAQQREEITKQVFIIDTKVLQVHYQTENP